MLREEGKKKDKKKITTVGRRDAESQRTALHTVLALPTDRPLFRLSNSRAARLASPPGSLVRSLSLSRSVSHSFLFNLPTFRELLDRLRNVHTHLKPSGVAGTLAVVSGDYDYYHYKQDNIDDKVALVMIYSYLVI